MKEQLTGDVFSLLLLDFADLENRVYAKCIADNKKAIRLPARKRRAMYGKPKLPWTIIHDCYQCNKGGGFLMAGGSLRGHPARNLKSLWNGIK